MEKHLLELPYEILLQIISFVPKRFELSQVCKKFYELVCAIDKNRYKMNIGRDFEDVRLLLNGKVTLKILQIQKFSIFYF